MSDEVRQISINYVDPRFDGMTQQFKAHCWEHAEWIKGEPLMLDFGVCDASNELATSRLFLQGFCDDDGNWEMDVWNRQMREALDGFGSWFVGLAMPGFGPLGNIVVVTTMERFNLRTEAISMREEEDSFVPQCWIQPGQIDEMMQLLPAIRHAVVQKG